MKQTAITLPNGNVYHCCALETGIDVCTTNFRAPESDRTGVRINRVDYFARGTFTIAPEKRWDPLKIHAFRLDGCFTAPTPAARVKLESEICEAAGIYAREHLAAMQAALIADKEDTIQRAVAESDAAYAAYKASEDTVARLRAERDAMILGMFAARRGRRRSA